MNHFVLLVLDSCRYDSMKNVWDDLECLPKLGKLELAHSFATWTLPSHFDFLSGRLPWKETKGERFSRGGGRLYLERIGELRMWQKRLGIEDKSIITDDYSIHKVLHRNGYRIRGVVSASPLGEGSMFSRLVDDYVCVGSKGDCLLRAVDCLSFVVPSFYIVNVCETHYPFYTRGGYDDSLSGKVLSGLRGVNRAVKDGVFLDDVFFSEDELKYLHRRQMDSVRYVDYLLPCLLSKLPRNTSMVVTSDHGEAFGESGFVGHGEVAHSVVLDVPFVEVSQKTIESYLEGRL